MFSNNAQLDSTIRTSPNFTIKQFRFSLTFHDLPNECPILSKS